MQRAADEAKRVAAVAPAAHPRCVPRVSRAVLCLLVLLGVGSSVVAWEDRVEATCAPAEIVAQIVERAPAPAPNAIDPIAAPTPATLPRTTAPPPPSIEPPAPAHPLLSLAPKTSPPRC